MLTMAGLFAASPALASDLIYSSQTDFELEPDWAIQVGDAATSSMMCPAMSLLIERQRCVAPTKCVWDFVKSIDVLGEPTIKAIPGYHPILYYGYKSCRWYYSTPVANGLYRVQEARRCPGIARGSIWTANQVNVTSTSSGTIQGARRGPFNAKGTWRRELEACSLSTSFYDSTSCIWIATQAQCYPWD